MRYNVWIMVINNEEPSIVKGFIRVISSNQIEGKIVCITMKLCKRKERNKTFYKSISSLFKKNKVQNRTRCHRTKCK